MSAEIQHTGALIGLIFQAGAKAQPRANSYDIGPLPSNQGQALARLASFEQLQISYYLRIIARLQLATARATVSSILVRRRPAHRAPAPRAGQARGPVRVRDVSEPPRHRSATRRELLTAGAVAGAAALAAPGCSPPSRRPRRAAGPPPPPDDAARLERVLSMAVLAAYVYEQVFAEGVLTGASVGRWMDSTNRSRPTSWRCAERWSRPAAPASGRRRRSTSPTGTWRTVGSAGGSAQLQGSDDALDLLVSVERSSIGSCYVALRGLTGSAAIVLVASIMANDAQHEAVVTLQRHDADARGRRPVPARVGRALRRPATRGTADSLDGDADRARHVRRDRHARAGRRPR